MIVARSENASVQVSNHHHSPLNGEDRAGSRSTRLRQTRILVDACRMFSELNRPCQKEISAFKELFYQFAPNANASDRRIIASLISRAPFTPRSIALYLATDTIDVAMPFLLYSPVLGEFDLKNIGTKMGPLYQEIIQRRQVSVIDPPLVKDEQSSVCNLTDYEENRPNELVQEVASVRPDSDWQAAPNKQDKIIELASIGGKLGRRKEEPKQFSQPAMSETNSAASSRHNSKRHEMLPKRDANILLKLAKEGRTDQICQIFSKYSNLQFREVEALLKKSKGNQLAYLVKAIGLEPPADLQLLLLLAPRYSRGKDIYLETKQLMSELDVGVCRMIFNQVGAQFNLPKLEETTIDTAMNIEDEVDINSANTHKAPSSHDALSEALKSRRESVLGRSNYPAERRSYQDRHKRYKNSFGRKQAERLAS